MTEFEPIEWAMQQTGMTVADVVAIILTARSSKPTKPPRKPNQLEQVVEFVDGEFDVRAADVVARGLCSSKAVANTLLSNARKAGLIDRIGFGVYAPKGTAALNDGA